jgi:hypothetical protein
MYPPQRIAEQRIGTGAEELRGTDEPYERWSCQDCGGSAGALGEGETAAEGSLTYTILLHEFRDVHKPKRESCSEFRTNCIIFELKQAMRGTEK